MMINPTKIVNYLIESPKRILEYKRKEDELIRKNGEFMKDFESDFFSFLFRGGPQILNPITSSKNHIDLVELVTATMFKQEFTEIYDDSTDYDKIKQVNRDLQIGYDICWDMEGFSPEAIRLYRHINKEIMYSLNFLFFDLNPDKEKFSEEYGKVNIYEKGKRFVLVDYDAVYRFIGNIHHHSVYCNKTDVTEFDFDIDLGKTN